MTISPRSLTLLVPAVAVAIVGTLPLGCDDDCRMGDWDAVCDTSAGTTSSTASGTTGTSSTMSDSGSSTTTGVNTTSTTDPTETSTTQTSTSTTGAMPICGDKQVDKGEQCDDGNQVDDDACSNACIAATCGDGAPNAPDGKMEECDDGNQVDDDACSNACVAATCGDNIINTPGGVLEECDDGNTNPTDGCSEQCYIERFVFVSSSEHKGNSAGLNGLAGADSICQILAEKANLTANGQTFKAWLSLEGAQSPSTRFPTSVTTAKGPFLLPDDAHTKIADNWADLTDGDLDHPISINESGVAVGESTVWTNTTPQGSPAKKGDCSAWTNSDNMAKAGIGSSNYADFNWTNLNDPNFCTNSARIYCFQVTP